MKNIIAFLLVLGAFASYGTYTMWNNKEFKKGPYARLQPTLTAQQDPAGYKASLTIAASFAFACFAGAAVLALREKKRGKSDAKKD